MFTLYHPCRDILYKVGEVEVLNMSAGAISSVIQKAFSCNVECPGTTLLTVIEFARYIDRNIPMEKELENVVSNTEQVIELMYVFYPLIY